jgi:Rieske Fe-S protein
MNRREFLRRIVIVAAMGGAVLSGGIVIGEKLLGSSGVITNTIPTLGGPTLGTTQGSSQGTVSTTQSSSNVPAGYVFVATLSQLTANAAYFNHPTFGSSILVNVNGQWKAFSATCTHQPCTVGYQSASIQCPCHGGTFDPSNGAVTGGPPPSRLAEYATLISNNNLYVGNSVIN